MRYTVIVLYPDYAANDWPYDFFAAWVHGNNPSEAARAAQSAAADANNFEYPAGDFHPLAIIPGGHYGDITAGAAITF